MGWWYEWLCQGIRPTPGGMDWIDAKRILTVMNTDNMHFVTLEILLHEDRMNVCDCNLKVTKHAKSLTHIWYTVVQKNLIFEVRLRIVILCEIRHQIFRLCVVVLDFEILASDFWILIKQTLDFILSHWSKYMNSYLIYFNIVFMAMND